MKKGKLILCMLLAVFTFLNGNLPAAFSEGLLGYLDELGDNSAELPSFFRIMEERQPDKEVTREDGAIIHVYSGIEPPVNWWRIIYELKFLGCSVGSVRGSEDGDQKITVLYNGNEFSVRYRFSDQVLEIVYPADAEIDLITPSFWINGDFALAGKSLFLGSYEQDNDYSDGAEPIEWTIADRVGDRVLLVSRLILDAKPYNDVTDVLASETTWKTCSLREWLNTDFAGSAFTEEERRMILPVANLTAETGEDICTTERVTLLRQVDLFFNPTMEFDQAQEKIWKCEPTPYAVFRGVPLQDPIYWAAGAGKTQEYGNFGNAADGGSSIPFLSEENLSEARVSDASVGVRPFIWIRLSDAEKMLY